VRTPRRYEPSPIYPGAFPQIVPKALHLENATSLALLESWSGAPAARAAAARMSSSMLVAVALAHEEALGAASRWAPYLELLPAAPPAPWLLPRDELEAAAAAALAAAPEVASSGSSAVGSSSAGGGGCSVEVWATAAAACRADMEAGAQAAVKMLAAASLAAQAASSSSGGSGADWLSPERLLWALGHVQSRSLGASGSSGLGKAATARGPLHTLPAPAGAAAVHRGAGAAPPWHP
jgi:hypothetical protein